MSGALASGIESALFAAILAAILFSLWDIKKILKK
jgi:hypothetical protein